MDTKERKLIALSASLDISPSDFQIAMERFNAVKNWLEDGEYESGSIPQIYLQGSFRLGTVVRPFFEDREGDFDIDQVCELSPLGTPSPRILKHDIGDRLKENADYFRMLDDEGKRCWTIEYASDESRPGFHLDVLPSLSARGERLDKIKITDKRVNAYSWSRSNPNGYYQWFKSNNVLLGDFIREEKTKIYERNRQIFSSMDDVPTQLLRTSLQRAIQIMKRHRDVYFVDKENKPISIIITTIATHKSTGGSVLQTIAEFALYCWERYEQWLQNGSLERDGILDYSNGCWLVPNPVDIGLDSAAVENFADRWNEDPTLPKAFFEWARQLRRDLERFGKSAASGDLNLRTSAAGDSELYSSILKKVVQTGIDSGRGNTQNLLDLIHLGIEGKMGWEFIQQAAQHQFKIDKGQSNEDVARVNFYQVVRHQNLRLSDEAKQDVVDILNRHSNQANYVLCCNLLLGTAEPEMVRRCIVEHEEDNILSWPILRLYDFSESQRIA